LNFPAAARNFTSGGNRPGTGGPGMSGTADRLYERVLVLRCQAGDEAAFAELVGRYGRRLHYYLGKLLRDAGGAEDVLQEVWLAVYRGVPQLADPGAFAAWLYRVARDRAFRELRRRRVRLRPLPEDELPADDADDPFTAADAEWVHAALDRLGPEHREVLLLRFMEEMSYEDIARVTGCPLGTVRSRLHHAKRALRGAIDRGKV
jgi:RNA polymerase sigma-70 factor (ECF subfamily)